MKLRHSILPVLLLALASCGGTINGHSTGPDGGDLSQNGIDSSVAAAPSPPADLTASWASPSAPVVRLSWTDTAENETSFVVERKIESYLASRFEPVAELPADTEEWTDREASISATAYTYRVLARNAAGDSPPSAELLLPSPLPAAPSGLCGRAAATSVTLNWHDNSDNEEGFVVLNELLGTTVRVAADVTAATISDLTADAIYLFQVYAFNSFGNSTPSNHLTIQTSSGGCGG